MAMIGFLVEEALRDLRRAGRLAASAVLLIALAMVAAGAFWFLSENLGTALAGWRDRVRVIVYLKAESAEPDALLARVREVPGVASARYVGKADALALLRQTLGPEASVAEHLGANPLPASLQITPSAAGSTPEGARDLLAALSALPEADEVAGGTDWVDRLAQWRRLLQALSVGAGGVLGVAAVLTVTTATTLVLHARRREIEIMRLVGAPELVIRLPLVLQGGAQGFLGAVVALALLAVSYRFLAPRLELLVSPTLGLPQLHFLAPATVVGLAALGTALGGIGAILARTPRDARA
jgi:cell division transport system permease protein